MVINIDKLRLDNLQTRTGLDEATVAKYTEAMRDQQEAAKHMAGRKPTIGLGKITVYTEDYSTYWLADGFHRVEAARRCGITRLEAEVARGGYVSALRYALKCNAHHGKPTTNEDKQNALQIAWQHRRELFGENDPTANWLATTCGVSERMAKSFYADIAKGATCTLLTPQRTGENGHTHTLPQRPVRPTRTTAQHPTAPVRPTVPAAPAPVAQAPTRPEYRDNNGGTHCVPVDCYGIEIPTGLQAAFDDKELHRLVKLISEARCLCKRETDAGNLAFAAVRQEVQAQLDNAYNFTKAAAPHCVCIMCQGHGCKECGSRGWQTKEQFERSCGAHPECAKWAGVQA